ncbi:signal peptidase II [Balneolaceae bacterium YR4-1]|uniref:Lipoprotein signal peptidase n=1 Tax=Halalkalibaculum roseum TaxID=2709311 RepID=A0A6M1SZL1_9BACT|nr:signal peptidase II [Halalkalibaculum roseum]NGP75315.1 signal peptidase II [Halalkalibaculum roseum]
MNRDKLFVLISPALVVIILDQLTKQLVRTTPSLQNMDLIPGWLALHYTRNPGMALGMDWFSTPVISVIAIIATIGIFTYILKTMHRANKPYLFCMGLVLGGAFGNIIDRLVMAKIESYGGILDGHVIDFIHFNLTISGYPVFPYIFNVADIAISTAIISLLVFNRRILPEENKEEAIEMESVTPEQEVSNSEIDTDSARDQNL